MGSETSCLRVTIESTPLACTAGTNLSHKRLWYCSSIIVHVFQPDLGQRSSKEERADSKRGSEIIPNLHEEN